MAKTTRKKKEPEKNLTIAGEPYPEQHVVSDGIPRDKYGHEIAPETLSPQEQEPQTVIPASQQPENPVSADPGANGAGQQTAQPAAPKISYEIVEAHFKKELTKFEFETILQNITNYKITPDNMGEAQLELSKGRKMLTKFEDIKKTLKARPLQTCKWIDNAFNSLKSPLDTALVEKQNELNRVAAEETRKKEELKKEENRKTGIKTAIDNFIIEQSQAIAGCKTNPELVAIQKFIGSHKAAKNRYQEFLPDLITRCESLNDLIKEQKKTIDDLEELELKKKEAETKGDDATLIALEDKKDELISKLAETKVVVQETAINQATKSDNVIEATPIITTIGARRTTWKAELVKKPDGSLDQKELANAFKNGMLKCEIDPEKTRTALATLRSGGMLKDKTEIIVNGIRYFEEKIY